ncbi:MAG: GDYXXLXY domain-containing protein [Planctomyces sp.]
MSNKQAESASLELLWQRISLWRSPVLVAAVVFQLLVLMSIVAGHYSDIARGQSVMLQVVPVDPRDMFRGDYVILSYEFSREVPPETPTYYVPQLGREIFIPLVPAADGRHYRSGGARWDRPLSGLFLKGWTTDSGQHEFGIGQFFVQEGQGHMYESAARRSQLTAEVSIDPEGKAILRKLITDN